MGEQGGQPGRRDRTILTTSQNELMGARVGMGGGTASGVKMSRAQNIPRSTSRGKLEIFANPCCMKEDGHHLPRVRELFITAHSVSPAGRHERAPSNVKLCY